MPKLKRSSKGTEPEKRIAIIDHNKCKPNSNAYNYLRRASKLCGRDCINVVNRKIVISELSCMACFNRAKRTPDGAVSVVKLPADLSADTTHRYDENAFKLHGLPTPRPGSVLGLLGTNGIGKSTAMKILSGRIVPNFGKVGHKPSWSEIIKYYRGCDLQNYFTKLSKGDLKVSIKPQLNMAFVERFRGKKINDVLEKIAGDRQERLSEVCTTLELNHLLNNEIHKLSGGELQRFAVAMAVLREANVYLFDECSSYLDVKQRLIVSDVVRGLISSDTYIIVVEHDLAVLDYMSDQIQCLYGTPGAYGVVTSRSSTANGINHYLSGYIPAENMRFRASELTFKINKNDTFFAEMEESEGRSQSLGSINYKDLTRSFTNKDGSKGFTLHIERGSFRPGEIVCLLGQNGCGKTTFMEILSRNIKDLGVSYKTQNNREMRRYDGTVREMLEDKINPAMADTMFRLLVMKTLNIDQLEDLPVKSLSGGERQRLAITICLGTDASVYLIDEPSADLDCEQRIVVSKVIKRWIINHLGKTCFLIEHDFMMSTTMADKIIVYEGSPGVECTARTPVDVTSGFNSFLKQLNVTFRRDKTNYRPRINKKGSVKDREQKSSNSYYIFDD